MHVLLGVTCCNPLILLALFSSFCVQLPTDCLAVLNHSCALLALSFGSCHLWLGILQWSPQVLLVLLSSWAWCLLSSVLLHCTNVTCICSSSWCAHPDSNRDSPRPTDFKSVVSTYSTMGAVVGLPGGTRTPDPQLRRLLL